MSDNQVNDNCCVVCFKQVTYYSIGECDHPVCHECSTRMRVLCVQNECPICRQVLTRVIFTETVEPYSKMKYKEYPDNLYERMHNIVFCSEEIKQAYTLLLEHRCKICTDNKPFRNFIQLSGHMRRVHELFFCDLCVENLKIFTFERKCYTRQQLAQHRRKGDTDDTSHRGHPLCQFCETRFMDMDELYRHLRKEHLFCHLCDADGRNHYYDSYFNLANHFRSDHFLCEEGECADNQLTSVFRTAIDFQAHKSSVHGRGLGKAAARQARILELQFNVSPTSNRPSVRVKNVPSTQNMVENTVQSNASAPVVNWSPNDFPSLAGGSRQLSTLPGPSSSQSRMPGSNRLARTEENFPALDKTSTLKVKINSDKQVPASAVLKSSSKPSVTVPLQTQAASARNFKLTQTSVNKAPPAANAQRKQMLSEDFPSLPPSIQNDNYPSIGAATSQPPKIAIVSREQQQTSGSRALLGASVQRTSTNSVPCVQRPPPSLAEAFPALPMSAPAPDPPKWITKPKEKSVKKKSEPAPAPKLPPSNFNTNADFPKLKNKKQANKNHTENNVTSASNINPPFNNITNSRNKKEKTKKSSELIVNGKISSESDIENQTNFIINNISNTECRTKQSNNSADSNRKKSESEYCAYTPPPNFQKRNAELVNNLMTILGSDEKMEIFKQKSRAFREDAITAREFLEHCLDSLGHPNLVDLLPELIALLPDMRKQKELARYGNPSLLTCTHCGQMVQLSDYGDHDAIHWPALLKKATSTK